MGPGGYSSQGLAINDDNVVAGWVQKQRFGAHYAAVFRIEGDTVRVSRIGMLPGDTSSYATAINNVGQVVGYSGDAANPGAFIFDVVNGMQPLGTLDPANRFSKAGGISDDGTVVGQSKNAAGVPHAFKWTPATGMVDPYPDTGLSDAPAINGKGQWVGHVDTDSSTIGVRISATGKIANLGALDASAPYSYGKGLNEVGQVVGYSADPVTLASVAFTWNARQGMTKIGILPGGFYSNALAVNDAGQVVGIADKPGGRGTTNGPFYYDKQIGMVDLETLIDPADPLYGKVTFDAAQDINNNGVIVANGIIKATDKYHAFVLIPKP